MTEAEWLACPSSRDAFEFLKGKVSDRKLRLIAVACCRATWSLLNDVSRRAVEVAEQYADGCVSRDVLRAVRDEFRATDADESVEIIRGVRYRTDFGGSAADEEAAWAATVGMSQSATAATLNKEQTAGRDLTSMESDEVFNAERLTRLQLRQDVLGPFPFRPVIADPSWLTSTVVQIAGGIYQERAFDRLPYLADALQDAGCENADVLDHCRRPGPHVRGCWVVDLVLGKE
jgi:hypothetical protein